MATRHPAQDMPAPKGYMCAGDCGHGIAVHREHGCDAVGCDCPAPFGRILPADGPPTWRAADLPDQSIVAGDWTVWIKSRPSPSAEWAGTNGGHFGDWYIDKRLADGAQVLRMGNGQEG